MAGLCLLTCPESDQYRELIPEDKDLQNEWEAAIDDPKKYVSLMVGQLDDEEQRLEKDKENYHNPSKWERTTKN